MFQLPSVLELYRQDWDPVEISVLQSCLWLLEAGVPGKRKRSRCAIGHGGFLCQGTSSNTGRSSTKATAPGENTLLFPFMSESDFMNLMLMLAHYQTAYGSKGDGKKQNSEFSSLSKRDSLWSAFVRVVSCETQCLGTYSYIQLRLPVPPKDGYPGCVSHVCYVLWGLSR